MKNRMITIIKLINCIKYYPLLQSKRLIINRISIFRILLPIIFFLIISCVHQPDEPSKHIISLDRAGAYILCEGLWGMDNSTLDRYNFKDGKILLSFFEQANPGYRLGDLANHIVLKGDTAFIAVSTAQTIEIFEVKSGKSLGRIRLEGTKRAPRRICIVNNSTAYVTDLYAHCVTEFNPTTFEIIRDNISVGPAPEGISFYNNYLFVANSGYGDYLASYPKAGTISVVNINSNQDIKTIEPGPNTAEVIVSNKNKKLYAAYYHLPSKEDSLGGIVEYDLVNLTELRRWRLDAFSIKLSSTEDSLLFISNNNICCLKLFEANPTPQIIIKNSNDKEYWYSFEISPVDNFLWVCNARNYQIDGEVRVYDLNLPTEPKFRFNVGVNPNNIVFFGMGK